ncbi:Ger(x)C family spore germination protein [Paenibacillus oenotherae]|uniref:Ger(X)C family spore germination protein n=1 Tax=Paenibacillus oenotherae TaxID=1435645 RepID=A0ABS7D2Y0_9BACL|nr:Ger(x)C family spore germination protein [Paenibacillus oenotherae]MBW7474284.1 Ger(x)C family spore germination protein [Paenibacillus oenotherae]
MKFRLLLTLSAVTLICVTTSSCYDQLNLENASTPLAFGMDLNEDNQLELYTSTPIFSKNIRKKSLEINATIRTLRQSKAVQNAQSPGSTQGRNFQVILVGKRLLQHEGWIQMLDVIFRDARNTVTDRVVAVDGALSEIMFLNPEDQPLLPVLLRGMITTSSDNAETVSTTAQELHRQYFEKGITPSISQVKVKDHKRILVTGTTLLTRKGRYAASLGYQESILLNTLQKKAKSGVSLTYSIPGKSKTGPFDTDTLSFTAQKIATKIKTSYQQSRFQFDIKLKIAADLTEVMFPYNVLRDNKQLEPIIAGLLKSQIEKLLKKFQRHNIDPVGFGLYARAYQYREYKKVQDRWAEALSDAVFHVSVEFDINAIGPVK